MIMTDQDHDGSHIKGLIMNFFHHFYPSLLKLPGFLVEFITPIIKARAVAALPAARSARCIAALLAAAPPPHTLPRRRRSQATKGKESISFYSMPEYEEWKERHSTRGWSIKYYKGAGGGGGAAAAQRRAQLFCALITCANGFWRQRGCGGGGGMGSWARAPRRPGRVLRPQLPGRGFRHTGQSRRNSFVAWYCALAG